MLFMHPLSCKGHLPALQEPIPAYLALSGSVQSLPDLVPAYLASPGSVQSLPDQVPAYLASPCSVQSHPNLPHPALSSPTLPCHALIVLCPVPQCHIPTHFALLHYPILSFPALLCPVPFHPVHSQYQCCIMHQPSCAFPPHFTPPLHAPFGSDPPHLTVLSYLVSIFISQIHKTMDFWSYLLFCEVQHKYIQQICLYPCSLLCSLPCPQLPTSSHPTPSSHLFISISIHFRSIHHHYAVHIQSNSCLDLFVVVTAWLSWVTHTYFGNCSWLLSPHPHRFFPSLSLFMYTFLDFFLVHVYSYLLLMTFGPLFRLIHICSPGTIHYGPLPF